MYSWMDFHGLHMARWRHQTRQCPRNPLTLCPNTPPRVKDNFINLAHFCALDKWNHKASAHFCLVSFVYFNVIFVRLIDIIACSCTPLILIAFGARCGNITQFINVFS